MPDIARLSIRLDDVDPEILRRIEVPVGISLGDLHAVIQIAMGWENAHLYAFHVGRSLSWGEPDPDWPDDTTRAVKTATLAELLIHLKRTKVFQYVYDFGDDWRHTVKLEALAEADPGATCPRLLDAIGACPPEDCGGPCGYAHFLEAIADPSHEDHQEMIAWHGPGFDPGAVDIARIHKALTKFANRRSGKLKPNP
jgi:hypothetical protein